jgi:hypothetical protein
MIDLNSYRATNFEYIKTWLANKPDSPIKELVSEIALATGVPVIAVSHFIGEIKGFTPELLASIERLKKFYGITEVVGQNGIS